MHRLLVLLFLAMILIPQSSQAMPIREFLKHPEQQQRIFALGAVSMLAFSEGINGHAARMKCITDWYEAKGDDQFFAALALWPRDFKARFKFDPNDEGLGYVELVLMRMANEVCPEK
jgi:hypothetical protein